MSKRGLESLFCLVLALFVSGRVEAQAYFQNNNTSCQTAPVLCTTYGGPLFCSGPEPTSIACRHVNALGGFTPVDFNGDTFADCVTLRENPFDNSEVQPHASVLINLAAGASACAAAPGQFGASQDYVLSGTDISDRLGNVIAGNLNTGNAEFAVINGDGSPILNVAPNLGTDFGPDDGTITTGNFVASLGFQPSFDTDLGERNSELFDCNNDTFLDAVYLVEEFSEFAESLRINVIRNTGSGLQNILPGDSYTTNIAPSSQDDAFLTIADFNGDAILDVAVGADIRNADIALAQVVTVCRNDGTCNFTCPATPTIDLTALHPGQNVSPASLESGDFDGDGFADLVVSEPGLSGDETQGLQYYFGNGDATFTRNQFVPYQLFDSLDVGVLTTGCYNNDNVVDVAVTDHDNESFLNNVGVFPSNAVTTIGTPQTLLAGARGFRGIDSADFDRAGGDDIIVLAGLDDESAAYVFLNALETVSAEAGPDQMAARDTPLGVAGGACAVNPENPVDPARFETIWTIVASPPGSVPSLTDATTLTPAFQGDQPGDYVLQLQCRTRCTAVATDTKTITIPGLIPTPSPIPTPSVGPTPSPVPTPTVAPVPTEFAQGGCLASLGGGSGSASAWGYLWIALMLAGLKALASKK